MDQFSVYINTLPVHNKSGGIKTFLLELLHSFAERKNEIIIYRLICSELNKNLFENFRHYSNFEIIEVAVNNINPLKRIFFEQFKLSSLLKNDKQSILLNICNIAVLNCPVPQITIIQAQMSIAALRKILPAKHNSISLFHKIYYDIMLQKSIDVSAKVICISEYMRQFLPDKKEKIVVIHEGVNLEKFEKDNGSSSYLPADPYILSLSTLFPHKNIDKIISAFGIFKKRYNLNYKLLIVGKDPDGKQLDILKKIARQVKMEDDIIFTNWVPTEEIPSIYQHASLFVYISSMEFFGLPVLEAMACKIPVIAANKMSIPEVVNNAGVLAEPDNVNDVAEKMYELLTNKNLRQDLIKKGNNNVNNFKWETTAAHFEHVFMDIVKKESATVSYN